MLQKHFRADRVNCVISTLCTNPVILPGNPTGYIPSIIILESPSCKFTGKDATPGCGWNSNFN